jgi:hypothetical protein
MAEGRRQFTDEFKREAIALLASSGRPLLQIAGELGISPSMLRNWRNRSEGRNAGPEGCGHLLGTAEMRFRLIEDHRDVWPVRVMCDALNVSPSGFYAWRSRSVRNFVRRLGMIGAKEPDNAATQRASYS